MALCVWLNASMSTIFNQRSDGSALLYIDGDLQFDTRDEAIYHECLALPAAALAAKRLGKDLAVLVCGGGDGFCVRELLKSTAVASIDLVDYDHTVLRLGKNELAQFNGDSLNDPRVRVHAQDCVQFGEYKKADGEKYDLVICDLTVPQELKHCTAYQTPWYHCLRDLLAAGGVIALNAVSPTKYPDAYWSMYNNLRHAELFPRAYRVALPSFAAQGYGADWGFLLGSNEPILAEELECNLELPEPRHQLTDTVALRRLFLFPASIAARRQCSLPADSGSGILIHYMNNPHFEREPTRTDWDALAFTIDPAILPQPHCDHQLLPLEVRTAVIDCEREGLNEERLLERVLELMPSLQRSQTREMVAEFLEDPWRFLRAINFGELVEKLLERAAKLPAKLVAELHLLKQSIKDIAGDYRRLMELGTRVITVTMLVVVLANLFSPDAAYGKGSDGGVGGYSADGSSFSRPAHTQYDSAGVEPELAMAGGFRSSRISNAGASVDEMGTIYPMRTYRYYPRYRYYRTYHSHHVQDQPKLSKGAYRLSPEADILDDGRVVISLTDNAFLLINDDSTTVVDSWTGEPILDLAADRVQLWRIYYEIARQRRGLDMSLKAKQDWMGWISWLKFSPWYADDQREVKNIQDMGQRLETALANIGTQPGTAPLTTSPPTPYAIEVISSAWMMPDGSSIALKLPSNQIVYMTGRDWYTDEELKQRFAQPYPEGFRKVIVAVLSKRVKDESAARKRLNASLADANQDLNSLYKDSYEYNQARSDTAMSSLVEYGSTEITLREALKRTADDTALVQQRIVLIQRQIDDLPQETRAAQTLLERLGP
jgi:spermidine synthase